MFIVQFMQNIKGYFYAQGGIYVFQLMDAYACSGMCLVFVVFWSSVAMGWGYGAQKWLICLKTMIGYHPGNWWLVCWKFIVPICTFVSTNFPEAIIPQNIFLYATLKFYKYLISYCCNLYKCIVNYHSY